MLVTKEAPHDIARYVLRPEPRSGRRPAFLAVRLRERSYRHRSPGTDPARSPFVRHSPEAETPPPMCALTASSLGPQAHVCCLLFLARGPARPCMCLTSLSYLAVYPVEGFANDAHEEAGR